MPSLCVCELKVRIRVYVWVCFFLPHGSRTLLIAITPAPYPSLSFSNCPSDLLQKLADKAKVPAIYVAAGIATVFTSVVLLVYGASQFMYVPFFHTFRSQLNTHVCFER